MSQNYEQSRGSVWAQEGSLSSEANFEKVVTDNLLNMNIQCSAMAGKDNLFQFFFHFTNKWENSIGARKVIMLASLSNLFEFYNSDYDTEGRILKQLKKVSEKSSESD